MLEEMIQDIIKKTLVDALADIVPRSNAKEVMTTKEVAEYLNVSESFIRKEQNNIPHFNLGSRILFNREDIDDWRLAKTSRMQVKRRTLNVV